MAVIKNNEGLHSAVSEKCQVVFETMQKNKGKYVELYGLEENYF